MTTQADTISWKEELKAIWPYATAVTTIFFFTAVASAWFVTWQIGPSNYYGYILAAVDPALASLFMVLICILRPAVFSGKQFAFPHTLTLPTVYMSLIYGFKLLGQDVATLQLYETIERFDLIWLDFNKVLFVWFVMIIVLSAIGVFKAKSSA